MVSQEAEKEIHTVTSPGLEIIRVRVTASTGGEGRTDSWKLSSSHVCTPTQTQRNGGTGRWGQKIMI